MQLLLILLFSVFCDSSEIGAETESYRDQDWDYDKDWNLVGLHENDKEIIYRPCNLRDMDCIRKFFAKHSQCSIVKGPAPDPLIFDRNTIYLPFANITILLKNVQISGLNDAEVKEFYINKATGNVVFAIDVKGLSERSPHTTIRYKRMAKESIVLTDYSTVTYGLITFTAVIPKVPNLQLHKADIHADIDDSNPPYVIGPKAYNSSDPTVQTSFMELTSTLPTALREAFLLKSSLYMFVFIQHNICDFGLKTISI